MRYRELHEHGQSTRTYGKQNGKGTLEGLAPDKIEGEFDCSANSLMSLKGGPKEVTGHYDCSHNRLTSLAGMATIVGSFDCSNNGLTTLVGTSNTAGWYNASRNKLTTLVGGPTFVGSDFYCDHNPELTSLHGSPETVGGSYFCNGNPLTSLAGITKTLGGALYCYDVQTLVSLQDIHEHLHEIKGNLSFEGCPIVSHVLGVFLIKGVEALMIDNNEVQVIVNTYLHLGEEGLLQCQMELIEKGFDAYAQV